MNLLLILLLHVKTHNYIVCNNLPPPGTKQLSKEEHDASLERVRATYKLVGFPMNVRPIVSTY